MRKGPRPRTLRRNTLQATEFFMRLELKAVPYTDEQTKPNCLLGDAADQVRSYLCTQWQS